MSTVLDGMAAALWEGAVGIRGRARESRRAPDAAYAAARDLEALYEGLYRMPASQIPVMGRRGPLEGWSLGHYLGKAALGFNAFGAQLDYIPAFTIDHDHKTNDLVWEGGTSIPKVAHAYLESRGERRERARARRADRDTSGNPEHTRRWMPEMVDDEGDDDDKPPAKRLQKIPVQPTADKLQWIPVVRAPRPKKPPGVPNKSRR